MGKQWTESRYTDKLLFIEAVLARMRDRFVRQTAVPPLALVLSNHYAAAAEDVQGVPRATTVLTKMMSLRAQATRASVCDFPAARRRL